MSEQLFDDPNTEEKEVEGVSAAKALQIAASQGQTIYTITQQNYAEVLPKLHLQASTLTDINNAMWAGHVVTVHEKTLSYKGWTGEGYSIVDPNTGAGAYLINGGANGSFLLGVGIGTGIVATLIFQGLLAGIIAATLSASVIFLGILAILALVLITTAVLILSIDSFSRGESFSWRCFFSGTLAGFGLSSIGLNLLPTGGLAFGIATGLGYAGSQGYGNLPSARLCLEGSNT